MSKILDMVIDNAASVNRAPARFVVSPDALVWILAGVAPLYDHFRTPGDRRRLFLWLSEARPELFPEIETVDGVGREITKAASALMVQIVSERGVSHYRDIPIVVNDADAGVSIRLESQPWGEV